MIQGGLIGDWLEKVGDESAGFLGEEDPASVSESMPKVGVEIHAVNSVQNRRVHGGSKTLVVHIRVIGSGLSGQQGTGLYSSAVVAKSTRFATRRLFRRMFDLLSARSSVEYIILLHSSPGRRQSERFVPELEGLDDVIVSISRHMREVDRGTYSEQVEVVHSKARK